MSDFALQHVLPADWTRARGFSHCVMASGTKHVSVAGQVAQSKGAGSVEAGLSFARQWAMALTNVVQLVEEAGGEAANITALRIYVTSMDAYNAAGADLGPGYAASLGKHFPAITLVQVVALVDPNALVEIEAEAILS